MRKTLAICYYRNDINDTYLYMLSFCDRKTTEKHCEELNAVETSGRHFFVKEVDTY